MFKKYRRLLTFIILAIFISITIKWIFSFPFSPELVCRVVPHDAIFVSRHISPAARVNALADSSTADDIINQLGVLGEDIAAALDDPGIRKLVDIIGSEYITCGFVPGADGSQSRFVFGAWIGGWTQPLRWGWFDHWMTDFYVHKLADGRRVWVMPFSDTGDDYYLSLVVNEGVLAGTVSKEKFGVLHILPRLQRESPLAATTDKLCDRSAENSCDDEFIASLIVPYSKNRSGHVYLHGKFSEISSDKITMRIDVDAESCFNSFLKENFYKVGNSDIVNTEVAGVIGDAPGILMTLPVETVSAIIDLYGGDSLLPEWSRLKKMLQSNGTLYLFVCGGKYYGHIMQYMKVPSIGAAFPLRKGIKSNPAVNNIIDELNASRKWGLLATADSHNRDIRIINSVRSGPFSKLGRNEKPAFAVMDGYLIALSNVDVLRRILAADSGKAGSICKWAESAADSESAIYAWSDLKLASDIAMKALLDYTLFSVISGNRNSVRYDTNEIKTLIKALGSLKSCAVHLSPTGEKAVLTAEIIF